MRKPETREQRRRAACGSASSGAVSTMRSICVRSRSADEQRHRRADRMREHVIGRRAVRQHHLLHDRLEVVHIIGEVAHMALAAVAEQPRRAALPARIEGGHREAAPAQVADRLEIFFDELGAAVQDDDRAAHRRAVGRPARIAQLDAVVRRRRCRRRRRAGRDCSECRPERPSGTLKAIRGLPAGDRKRPQIGWAPPAWQAPREKLRPAVRRPPASSDAGGGVGGARSPCRMRHMAAGKVAFRSDRR